MKEIELRVLDMSTMLKPSNSYALVLEEKDETHRKLALIIGALEAQTIRVLLMPYQMPRPFTHDLILNLLHEEGMIITKSVIYEVKDGVYYSFLYIMRADGSVFRMDARTTDAISLSLRDKFPVYVYEDILDREMLHDVMRDGMYSMSVNSVDTELLKQALSEAIGREDYEAASKLRDEIKRRELENHTYE